MRCEWLVGTALIGLVSAAAKAEGESLGDDAGLPALVVTATRQERSLYQLAGNSASADLGRILSTQPERPAELLNQLPGVAIEQGSGEEQILAIRSPALNGGAGQGSFLLLEDGVPLRAAGFGNVNGLYEANVEQAGSVEILRGPGSALYGSNAVHGLINVIPRAPDAALSGALSLIGGSFGLREALGTLSGNGLRLSAEEHHEDGWRDDTRLDERKLVLRDVWESGGDRVTGTLSGQSLDQQTGTYILGKDAYLQRGLDKTNPIPAAYRKAESLRFMLRWQHDLGEGLSLSLTPYARYGEMNFMMFYLPSQAIQDNEHHSFGLQSALYRSFADGSLAILGVDAELTSGFYRENQTKPGFRQGSSLYPQGLHYDLSVTAKVLAPYLHTEWQILDGTRLEAGFRLEETLYGYRNDIASGIFGLYQRPPSRSDAYSTATPKLGLVRQWLPELATYAAVRRGARAPQITDLYELQNKQKVGQIRPETVDSAEIGTRGRVDRLSFDLSAYWMDKRHYFYRAADGTNIPDGKTLHRGVELAISAPLPGGFDIGASASHALHTYAFSRLDSTPINSVATGTAMPNAPRSQADARLGYRPGEDVRIELEWAHMGAYFTDNANTHAYGGHELLNLRGNWRIDDNFALQGKVMNLADRAYADRAAITTTGVDEYFPGAPQSFLLELTASF